jgi:integrase
MAYKSDRFDIAALLKVQGRHRIGHGLSLHVRGAAAIWVYQYRDPITGAGRSKSFGSPSPSNDDEAVSITVARRLRDAFRQQLRAGTVPAAAERARTFAAVLDEYIAGHAPTLKGGLDGKEAAKFLALRKLSLAKYPIGALTRAHIASALQPWSGRPSCNAIRVKIETVIDYAKGHGLFAGDNPADRGPLRNMIALRSSEALHHPMLDWRDVPSFFAELAAIDTPASKALRFTLLTAARPTEAREATWSEINSDAWTIPAERMKEAKAFTVPLAPAAIELLGERGGGLIFGKLDPRKVLGLIKGHTATDGRPCDTHGLRSTFAGWASEMRYAPELIEMALSHAVGDAVARAYARSDKIGERREMLNAWAKFATGTPSP